MVNKFVSILKKILIPLIAIFLLPIPIRSHDQPAHEICKNAKDYKTKRLPHNVKKHAKNVKRYVDNNPQAKLAASLRQRMRKVLKGNIKCAETLELLGCSLEEWEIYLENKFTDGMNWDNYGKDVDNWQIDHIKPCASFKLELEEEQKACFHYSNTQPLWQPDNASKGCKF